MLRLALTQTLLHFAMVQTRWNAPTEGRGPELWMDVDSKRTPKSPIRILFALSVLQEPEALGSCRIGLFWGVAKSVRSHRLWQQGRRVLQSTPTRYSRFSGSRKR